MALTIKELAEKAKESYKDSPYNKECYYDGFVDGAESILDIFKDTIDYQEEIPTDRFPFLHERVYYCVKAIIRELREE